MKVNVTTVDGEKMNIEMKMGEKNFEQFCADVERALSEYYGEEANVQVRDVMKNNNITLKGLSVAIPGKTVMPTIYLEHFYELYLGGLTFGETVAQIVRFLRENDKEEKLDVSFFTEYEKVKDKIFPKLINAQLNAVLLEKVPHRKFLNLAVVFYVELRLPGDALGSVLVYEEHRTRWGATLAQLQAQAMQNAATIYPAEFMPMEELLSQIAPEKSAEIALPNALRMYVVSNTKRCFGASVMLYDSFLEKACMHVGERFAILPSSIHELILVPVDCYETAVGYAGLIGTVNAESVDEMEVLSDVAYYYDRDAGVLKIADEAVGV